MNPHGATVSDRAPKVAAVLAPERAVASGRYRAGRTRDKGRHHQAPARHFPRWFAPAAITTAVATITTVSVVAFGGGNDPAPPAAAVTTTVAAATSTTVIATTTTLPVALDAEFWEAAQGDYTGVQNITKVFTIDQGFIYPTTPDTLELNFTIDSGCTTTACTMSGLDNSTGEFVNGLQLAREGEAVRLAWEERVPCEEAGASSNGVTNVLTWDFLLEVTGRAADGHVTDIGGGGIVHTTNFDDCAFFNSNPVDFYVTWELHRP